MRPIAIYAGERLSQPPIDIVEDGVEGLDFRKETRDNPLMEPPQIYFILAVCAGGLVALFFGPSSKYRWPLRFILGAILIFVACYAMRNPQRGVTSATKATAPVSSPASPAQNQTQTVSVKQTEGTRQPLVPMEKPAGGSPDSGSAPPAESARASRSISFWPEDPNVNWKPAFANFLIRNTFGDDEKADRLNIWVVGLSKSDESAVLTVACKMWDGYGSQSFADEERDDAFLTDDVGTVYHLIAPLRKHKLQAGEIYRVDMAFRGSLTPNAKSLTLHSSQFENLTVLLYKPQSVEAVTETTEPLKNQGLQGTPSAKETNAPPAPVPTTPLANQQTINSPGNAAGNFGRADTPSQRPIAIVTLADTDGPVHYVDEFGRVHYSNVGGGGPALILFSLSLTRCEPQEKNILCSGSVTNNGKEARVVQFALKRAVDDSGSSYERHGFSNPTVTLLPSSPVAFSFVVSSGQSIPSGRITVMHFVLTVRSAQGRFGLGDAAEKWDPTFRQWDATFPPIPIP